VSSVPGSIVAAVVLSLPNMDGTMVVVDVDDVVDVLLTNIA
jgi:hypothetical protein